MEVIEYRCSKYLIFFINEQNQYRFFNSQNDMLGGRKLTSHDRPERTEFLLLFSK